MSRLLFFTEAFWPSLGGVQVLGVPFAQSMMSRGHEVVVVTGRTDPYSPDVEDYRGIPIYRFPFVQAIQHRSVTDIAELMTRLNRLYQDVRPDLYHVYLTGPGVLFHSIAAGRWSAPSLVAIQVALPNRKGEALLATRLLASAAWVTANSNQMLEYTRSLVPELSARSSVIYNGLPLPEIEPTVPEVVAPRFLCLGRVVHDKGFDLAVRAFSTVLASVPDARLVIAGDGSARDGLESMAADLNVERQVEFLGRVERESVPELINAAAAVLMPSRCEEAFGLVALEAAQMARPTIATRVGGLPEVVVHGETGLLIASDDPAALADAMLRIVSNPTSSVVMGRKARERARELFGWERYVDEYEDLYDELVLSATPPTESSSRSLAE